MSKGMGGLVVGFCTLEDLILEIDTEVNQISAYKRERLAQNE